MVKKTLTKKQEEIFVLIGEYFEKNGFSPTIVELKEMLKVKSLRSIVQYLDCLESKGFIYRIKNKTRGIMPVGYKKYLNPELIEISVCGSAGCDNQSVFADSIENETISVFKKIIEERRGEIVGVKAMGDSMSEAGINDGDIVLVEKTENVNNNERVVVVIDDMAVIKRIYFSENTIILNPDSKNKEHKQIVVNKDFKIFGKVIDVIKKVVNNNELEIIPIKDY